ncbi:MAG: hypothetical protein AB7F23_09125, partial [Phycisphaerae bacterium]
MRPYNFVDKFLHVILFAALALTVRAGQIVPDFDDTTALVTLTSATASSVTAANITNGKITYAARFNPAAAMADAAPAIILEDGGTSNGTGLYLVNGNVVFVGKYGSMAGWSSLTLEDIDFSDSTIAVTLGQVNFGTENNVYVCYDLSTGLLTGSVNESITEFIIAGSNTGINFDGNNSVFFLAQNNKGWLGGLGEASFTGTTIPELTAENCVNMVQTAGYSNQL